MWLERRQQCLLIYVCDLSSIPYLGIQCFVSMITTLEQVYMIRQLSPDIAAESVLY